MKPLHWFLLAIALLWIGDIFSAVGMPALAVCSFGAAIGMFVLSIDLSTEG